MNTEELTAEALKECARRRVQNAGYMAPRLEDTIEWRCAQRIHELEAAMSGKVDWHAMVVQLQEKVSEMRERAKHHHEEMNRLTGVLEARKSLLERAEGKVHDIDAALVRWAYAAGWPIGLPDTTVDMVVVMRILHREERSLADLAASGGIGDAP